MNRLIPATSPLMNRIEFVGNAIFIPFFLIGVGMLIDYRAFFKSWESIEVSIVAIVMVTAAKYIAACLTQKTFRLSRDQRTLLFGLSSAHVAATLAAVMVGYNVVLGHTPEGEPIPPAERERAQRHDPDDTGDLHDFDLRLAAWRPQHRHQRGAGAGRTHDGRTRADPVSRRENRRTGRTGHRRNEAEAPQPLCVERHRQP